MRLVWLLILTGSAWAAGPSGIDLSLGKRANENGCTIGNPSLVFATADREAFARVLIRNPGPTDRFRVEWLSPTERIVQTAEYAELPATRTVCALNQLSIAAFPPADEPGRWKVRVIVNENLSAERSFTILGSAASVSVSKVITSMTPDGSLRVNLTGTGFVPNSVVHIAQYTRSLAWQYFAAELPESLSSDSISVRTAPLAPGEYIVMVGTPEGALSAPVRLLIASAGGYKLPTPADEQWVVTQGPYGGFSHWNRSLHAWDIAPRSGRTVVAMRSGAAYTHDLGLGRTPGRRSFGNYITVDHGDGEFSHYAHLQTRSFLVKNGEAVAQGQPLAVAGNSGYALGPGGGYHVHVHVTKSPDIAAQSIPFSFEDYSAASAPGFTGTVTSSNAIAGTRRLPVSADRSRRRRNGAVLDGSVQPAAWWSDVVSVPARTKEFRVEVAWANSDAAHVDLHLVSPTGRHYGWYGDQRGYSGQNSHPQTFTIRSPEAGFWRIAVQGTRGSGPIPFKVSADFDAGSAFRPVAGTRDDHSPAQP